jgi:hypothetical protein
MSNRSKAFFINGGAGRVLCSIPALEKYERESGDKDFVIVCEGGMEFYKGHPTLHKHAYDSWHKGLFENHLKDKDIVSPEPYRVWDYYNQKCSLSEGFDIEINGRSSEENTISDPVIKLTKAESIQGYQAIQEIKAGTGKDKVLVIQPFGRSVVQEGDFIYDPSSRSFELSNINALIYELRTEYAVIIMSEIQIPLEKDNEHATAQPQIQDIRMWASIISSADHFLGCDSVGQHIAKAVGTTATIVTGSTYPINITYPNYEGFDIIDVGEGRREYSPIRISMDDERDRANNDCISMTPDQEVEVLESCIKFMGKGELFTGEVNTTKTDSGCCSSGKPVMTDVGTYPTYDMSKGNAEGLLTSNSAADVMNNNEEG